MKYSGSSKVVKGWEKGYKKLFKVKVKRYVVDGSKVKVRKIWIKILQISY